jgi:hypothetical protein
MRPQLGVYVITTNKGTGGKQMESTELPRIFLSLLFESHDYGTHGQFWRPDYQDLIAPYLGYVCIGWGPALVKWAQGAR